MPVDTAPQAQLFPGIHPPKGSCCRHRAALANGLVYSSRQGCLLVTQSPGTLQCSPPRQKQPGTSSSPLPSCFHTICNPFLFLSLWEAGLFHDGNWSFSPWSSLTSTAHRLQRLRGMWVKVLCWGKFSPL